MKKILDCLIRVIGSILGIHVINMILISMGVATYVGINGYTVALSMVLGIPGILGLYAMLYLMA